MGDYFMAFYRERISHEVKLAFFSTFICCFLVHMYKITNTFPNCDSIQNYYSSQNILESGRWALSVACGFSSYYDLPWMTGILSFLFLALTACLVTALFQLRNPVVVVLSGALLATSSATVETLLFQYTADGYFLAMFLAALGVYLSRIDSPGWKFTLGGICCLCIACGIYQAYVSFALLLSIFYFLDMLMLGRCTGEQRLRWIGRQIFIYAASMALYFAIWKMILFITDIPVTDYQGIKDVGTMHIGKIVNGCFGVFKTFCSYFLQHDPRKAGGLVVYGIRSIVFLLIFAAGLVIAFRKSRLRQNRPAFWEAVIALLAVIPCAGLWNFVSMDIHYRPIMLQAYTLLFVFTAVLFERWAVAWQKELVCLFLFFIVFHNAVLTNITYYYLQLSYERTYADVCNMVVRINDFQSTRKFKRIAIVGNRKDQERWDCILPNSGIPSVACIKGVSVSMKQNMAYKASHILKFMDANFNRSFTVVPDRMCDALQRLEEVRNMPCWPDSGSLRVIGGTLVMKLTEQLPSEN